MTHTPGPERSAIYELLRYGRKHDGPWTEAITGDQLIDEEYADTFTAAPDMKLALEHVRDGHTDMDEIMAAIAKAEGRTA